MQSPVPERKNSPEELFRHLEEKDSLAGLLKDIPGETREKIRREICEELEKAKAPAILSYASASVFLFSKSFAP